MKRYLKYILILYIVLSIPLQGKARDEILQKQLNIGIQLENAGQLQAARAVYENLYLRYPGNASVFERYKSILFELQDFATARMIIRDQIHQNPNNVQILLSEAELQLHLFQSDSALARIHQIIEMKPDDASRYLLSGNLLTSARRFEDAIQIYNLGRKRLEQDGLFSLQTANVYKLNAEYEKATEALLVYYKTNPKQFRYVEREILRFPMTSSVLPKILSTLEKRLKDYEDPLPLQKLMATLYMKAEDYQKALQLTLQIERQTPDKEQGRQLHVLANQAFQEEALSAAAEAFLKLIQRYPHYQGIDEAWLDLGKVYQVRGDYQKAEDAYSKAMIHQSRRNVYQKAILAKGLLQRDCLNQPDNAAATFSLLQKEFYRTREGQSAVLYLGETRILQGRLNEAQDVFQNVLNHIPDKMDLQLKGLIHLAKVYYFQGLFTKSLNLLQQMNKLREKNQDPGFNDGLSDQFFIHRFYQSDSLSLRGYARAELAVAMRNPKLALIRLDSLLSRVSGSMYPYVLSLKSDVAFESGDLKTSLSASQALADRSSQSLLKEKASWRTIQIYQKQHRKKLCIEACEKFLVLYPQSLYIDEVRQIVRELSGENR